MNRPDSRNRAPVPYLVEELEPEQQPELELNHRKQPGRYEPWREQMRQKERYRAPQPEQPPMQKYPLQQLTAGQAFAGYAGAHLLRPLIALLQPLATALALALIATAAYAVYLNFAKITAWLTW